MIITGKQLKEMVRLMDKGYSTGRIIGKRNRRHNNIVMRLLNDDVHPDDRDYKIIYSDR